MEWRSAYARLNGEEAPLVFYRRRIRAKFSEVLELKQFPVDSQVFDFTYLKNYLTGKSCKVLDRFNYILD